MLDSPDKLALYRRSLDAFTHAARLAPFPHEKVAIPFADRELSGWLLRPRDADRPDTVIIFGGADGWREEYYEGALYLIERGVGALLLDGPGQGESRMIGGIFLDRAPELAFSAAVTFLRDDPRTGRKVGIWGNSLGGNFALRTAAADSRIVACCDNSGPPAPHKGIETFPRISDRLRAMVGGLELDETRNIFEAIALTPENNRVACDLLVLQGNNDPLVSAGDAAMIYESAPSNSKTMLVWDDGDHCIYNHSHEKHTLIADWFAKALR
jgi:alpha-beta hydrolase superfamily lysophospholipase